MARDDVKNKLNPNRVKAKAFANLFQLRLPAFEQW